MPSNEERDLLAEVGHRIRANRTEQGVNLTQLAILTGISAPAQSLIESGRRDIRLTTLSRIAQALRVPMSTLLEDEDDSDPGAEANFANDGRGGRR